MLLSLPLDIISPALYFFLVENVSCISKIFHKQETILWEEKSWISLQIKYTRAGNL